MTAKNHITPLQLFGIILQSQIGIAILTMPYELFKEAKFDSWLSILLTGLFIQILIFLHWFLARRYPTSNFFEIITKLLGRKLGIFLCFLYSIYFICLSSIVLSLYSNIIADWLLPHTPHWVTKALMISIAIYVVKDNLRVIGRFFLLCTFVSIFMIPLTFYSLKDGTLLNILPIGFSNYLPILKGTHEAFFLL
nr:GerAB/ArcD/ProY family transporter [Bacillus massiliigorillae]